MALIGFHRMEEKRERSRSRETVTKGMRCPGRFMSCPDAPHSLLSLMKPQEQSHGPNG
jgi:hypothetical protein